MRQLAQETDESATATLFVELCRQSPALRHWLWEDLARDAKTRDLLASRLRRRTATVRRFAELTEEFDSWREEQRLLQAKIPRKIYGGLTWQELEKLRPLPSRTNRSRRVPPRPGLDRLDQLAAAARLVREYQLPAKRRSAVGYTDWWKLQALFYILRHPRAAYRTRELRAHLAQQGLPIGTKDIRRFCARHGIARDMRAGRPPKTQRRNTERHDGQKIDGGR